MEIAIRQIPGVSTLVQDFFEDFEKVRPFYGHHFREWDDFKLQCKLMTSRPLDRSTLTAVLEKQNHAWGCDRATIDNIKKLNSDQSCVVVTGQQVGLFSGPLYTIYKSITAIKLAQQLSDQLATDVIPVFWMASEDHDFEEVNHIHLLDNQNRISEIRYPLNDIGLKIPAAKRFFTNDVDKCILKLDESTHESEFKKTILSDLGDAYQTGLSFSDGFGIWMTRLFKSYGLVFIDASHPDLKSMGRKIFSQEIADDSPSTKAAMQTSEELNRSQYHQQIPLRESIYNLFLMDEERHAIKYQNGDLHINGIVLSKSELLKQVEKEPHLFSPNALLRPLYQDSILPTVAYIGGPGEIAYFAQMKSMYESFDLPVPVIYPRKFGTLLDKKVTQILSRFQLKMVDLWHRSDQVIYDITKQQIPKNLDGSLKDVSSQLIENFQKLKIDLENFEPTLGNSADTALGKINHQIQFLEKKIHQASKKRNEIITRQLHKAKDSVYPNHHLQERLFNITPYLIKYGYGFIETLFEKIDINNYHHQVIEI